MQEGFECIYSPILISETEDKNFYSPGKYFTKLTLLLKGVWRRCLDVLRAGKFDTIFIYREAFMTGTTIFEKLMKARGAKIIYDFDDAIWNHDVSAANKALGWLKRPEKIDDIVALSDLVIAGNTYLADYALQYNSNTIIIPSTIDMEYYTVPTNNSKSLDKVTIGWSGSLTTIEHFKTIIPVLQKLKAKYGSKLAFKVFGTPDYENEELGIKGIGWKPQNEVQEIASFDIGIMPLPDNKWTRGKCGMKGLQYMALEVATVMSAVGANKDIIAEGENGMLANSDEEWFHKLCTLVEDSTLRHKLGKAGRKTIAEHYSCQALNKKYVAAVKELIQN
jgi:glycosyltransferase involved in cell wall biosynthesis